MSHWNVTKRLQRLLQLSLLPHEVVIPMFHRRGPPKDDRISGYVSQHDPKSPADNVCHFFVNTCFSDRVNG